MENGILKYVKTMNDIEFRKGIVTAIVRLLKENNVRSINVTTIKWFSDCTTIVCTEEDELQYWNKYLNKYLPLDAFNFNDTITYLNLAKDLYKEVKGLNC